MLGPAGERAGRAAAPNETASAPLTESTEAQEQPSETLPSLDELLPEQFGDLTAPWFGDLDGMGAEQNGGQTHNY